MAKSKNINQEVQEETAVETEQSSNEVNKVVENVEKVTEIVNKTSKNEVTSVKNEIFAYIGPTLPRNTLMANAILTGSLEEIKKFYKEEFDKYPTAIKLIIPISKLSEYKVKVAKPGNVINKYFNEILAEITAEISKQKEV